MGPLILIVLGVLLIAFLVFAYSRGGEVPTQRVEKQIALPSGAGSSEPASPESAQPEG